MDKQLRLFTGLSFMLAALFFLALVPGASANGIQDQIDALKSEVAKLEGQQMELKKQATEAAAALPTFSYRPGRGVTVEAADRSWSFALSHETHFMMPFQSGKDQRGRTLGEVMGRRFRQEWTLCLNNCFYTWISRLDLDGFGTKTDLQRGMFEVHFEQVNPWLPTFYIGMDIPTRVATPFRQDSSAVGAQAEYDLMSRNNGYNTGRTGQGIGFVWEELPVGGLFPGRADASIAIGAQGRAEDGERSFTDKKDYMLYFRVDPFSKLKNPWLRGFSYSIGVYFCNNDDKALANLDDDLDNDIQAGCTRNRVQDHGPGGRQTLFDSGEDTFGRGRATFISTGIRWIFGPYRLRAILGFQDWNNRSMTDNSGTSDDSPGSPSRVRRGAGNKARNFLIGHDVFIWSPKGFLTGSSGTPGSILFGYHFERNNYECGKGAQCGTAGHLGQFHRNRIILNEWDLWYFFMPGKSLGVSWLWYDASNLRSGRGQAQENLGVSKAGRSVAGKGGDWMDVILGLRVNF